LNDLGDELRALGENLRSVFQAAWVSDDRRRLQADLERGLDELATSLRSAAREFGESETGQRLKEDMHDLGERLRSGEVESKARQDLTDLLRRLNDELGRAAASWSSRQPPGPGGQS
jgi:hypothetical protein